MPAGQFNLNILGTPQKIKANKSKVTQVLFPTYADSLGVPLLKNGTISHPITQAGNLGIIPDKFLSLTTPTLPIYI